jgi:riboflavin-specific deaminase-like protein
MNAAASRPFVLMNLAVSADGKIASADRSITTFGSPRDLAHLYEVRATVDAILCGARTIEETGATLGNGPDPLGAVRRRRKRRGLAEFPLRIVVSGSGSIRRTGPIWTAPGGPLIVLVGNAAPKSARDALEALGARVWRSSSRAVDLHEALARLHREHGVRRLLSEGGGQLNAALLEADLVDELHWTHCPLILGGRTAPSPFDGIGFPKLAQATIWRQVKSQRIGDERFAVYRRDRSRGSGTGTQLD